MIRRATEADLQALLSLAPLMTAQAVLPVDKAKSFAETARTLCEGRAFVAMRDGEIVGSVAYDLASPWYSAQTAMFDKWMGLRADQRRSLLAGKMLLALEQEAGRLSVPLFIGVSGDFTNVGVFARRYQRVAVQFRKG